MISPHAQAPSSPVPYLSALLQQAAQAAAGLQQYPAGALYVLATPIGNLADITLRAIHVLGVVDAVACEDTRHSSALLRHLGIEKPLLALHEHNERQAAHAVIERLQQGQRVAYVSDAGTPAVSDPGAALVAAVAAAGHRCLPLPGASSALAALSVAGDALGSGFTFTGFLPPKGPQRQSAIKTAMQVPHRQVLFEAPHRIAALMQDLAAQPQASTRLITLCRELTKQFETVLTQPASQWPHWLAQDPYRCKGEFVLVIHALAVASADPEALSMAHDHTLLTLLAEMPLKQAVAIAVSLTGAPRNQLYARALALRS
jgi:16S rRNA (cytidine1402-2'-O)-methyltransferase